MEQELKSSYLPLKAVLYFSAIFHILAGLYIVFSGDSSASYGEVVFGMTIVPDPQMLYVLKSAGIYALAFGVVILLAAGDPEKYRHVIYVIIGMYSFRCINRIVSVNYIQETFAVTQFRAWLAVCILGTIAGLLFYFRPRR